MRDRYGRNLLENIMMKHDLGIYMYFFFKKIENTCFLRCAWHFVRFLSETLFPCFAPVGRLRIWVWCLLFIKVNNISKTVITIQNLRNEKKIQSVSDLTSEIINIDEVYLLHYSIILEIFFWKNGKKDAPFCNKEEF